MHNSDACGLEDCSVKDCPLCRARFSRADLIRLPTVVPIGMFHVPADEEGPALTEFYFNHTPKACRSTFATPVEVFAAELAEPVPAAVLADTEACEGHCSRIKDLAECHQECGNAPYRRFLLYRLVPRK